MSEKLDIDTELHNNKIIKETKTMEKRTHIRYSGEEYWVTERQLERIKKERKDGIAYWISQGASEEDAELAFQLVIMKDDD